MFRTLSRCRLCKGNSLDHIFVFPEVPLGNNLCKTSAAAKKAKKYPLSVLNCQTCGHYQLKYAVNPEILFATNYTYLSGVASSFREHFKNYVQWIEKNTALIKGDTVFDVGSNDGSCLSVFKKNGYKVVGVDPASRAAETANQNGIFTYNNFFNEETKDKILEHFGRPKLITSHNVLAHVDDLNNTFDLIRDILPDKGWLCFEVGYFRSVLENGMFDTIYHEHLDYHLCAPLTRHLSKNGFDIVKVETNEIQGGSLRLLCQKSTKGLISETVMNFISYENKFMHNNKQSLVDWQSTISEQMKSLARIVKKARLDGKKVIGYGAPTKAALMLELSGLSSEDIDLIVEDNPLKAGRYLPGTGIPILSTSTLTSYSADLIVVFAWNFFDEILAKLRDEFNFSGKVIKPCPRPEIIEVLS